ncbi:MAG: hypothetical protein JXR77_11625, partial [Lentisphaeria bacterium]|nr:hypothetical protein [Lentisphaeria bacterium]
MTTFTGTRAAALTWTAGGHCRGLAVRRSGRTCRVVACWEADAGADSSVAETLANGLRALGLGESTVLVVGAEDLAAGVVDLDIPALRADELRHAVAFELRRQAPLPDDRLAWAYRVIPGAGNGKLHVRLYYLRQAVWERWLNDISGLGRGVDAVIPPVAALDPILGDTPVAFGNGESGFLFAPRGGGCRDAA